jgi:hypothetical protein
MHRHPFFLVIEFDSSCGTEFFARFALALFKENAVSFVNGIFQRHCLGIGYINSLPLDQALVVIILYLLGAFLGTGTATNAFFKVHVSWMLQQVYLKISGLTMDVKNLGKGEQFDV